MGLFDGLFGGGDDTVETKQTVEYPSWMTDAMKSGFGLTAAMTAPFIQIPKAMVAGFTPDQTMGFDLMRDAAKSAFTGSPVRSIAGAPQLAGLTNATAAQVGAGDIAGQMNPFISSVLGSTVSAMNRQKNADQAAIGARAAQTGAFGSQEAMERALSRRSHNENLASTVSNLMAGGFESAAGRAENNVGRQQQVNLTNAGAANALSQWNAGTANDYGLRAAGVEDGLANNLQQRQLAAIQGLLGTGAAQQGLAQSSLDTPWTALSRLLGQIPSVTPSTTTGVAPDTSPSGFQTALGLGASILGMGTGGGGTIAGGLFNKLVK